MENNNTSGSIQATQPPRPPKKEEKYIFNNKIYNLTTSKKLFSYISSKPSNMKLFGKYPIPINVNISIYESKKESLFVVMDFGYRIAIRDINKEEAKKVLIENNELELLEKYFPDCLKELEEV